MGFIYLINEIGNERYKIGVAKNISKRLKQLQTGNGDELLLINSFETDYPYDVEKMLHLKFHKEHEIGEWFNLNLTDVNNFINICNQIDNNIKLVKENKINIID